MNEFAVMVKCMMDLKIVCNIASQCLSITVWPEPRPNGILKKTTIKAFIAAFSFWFVTMAY